MQPVAIGVEAVLNMINIDGVAVLLAEMSGFVPGGGLELNQFKVTLVSCVAK